MPLSKQNSACCAVHCGDSLPDSNVSLSVQTAYPEFREPSHARDKDPSTYNTSSAFSIGLSNISGLGVSTLSTTISQSCGSPSSGVGNNEAGFNGEHLWIVMLLWVNNYSSYFVALVADRCWVLVRNRKALTAWGTITAKGDPSTISEVASTHVAAAQTARKHGGKPAATVSKEELT